MTRQQITLDRIAREYVSLKVAVATGAAAHDSTPNTATILGHTFTVKLTGDSGFNTGRPRAFVKCETCGVLLHENTTGADSCIIHHLLDKEGST